MANLNYVWFGKHLQVVNTGLCYQVYNGSECLTPNGYPTKRLAISRAILIYSLSMQL